MTTAAKLKDGWYGLWPEGGPYGAIKIRDGCMHDVIWESEAGSHRAGGNWHYIPVHDEMDRRHALESMEHLEWEEHEAVVASWDDELDPEMVHAEYLGLAKEMPRGA